MSDSKSAVRPWLAAAALLLAAAACRDPEPPRNWGTGEPDLQALARRVAALEQGTAAPDPKAAHVDVPARASADFPDLTALTERLDRLERELAELRRHVATLPVDPAARREPDPTPEERAAQRAVEVRDAKVTILDPRADEAAKGKAWGALRFGPDDAWNDAIVAEMVRIGLTSTDDAIRADVWRQADGNRTHLALVPALLQALTADAAPGVREEAAETLANYRDNPQVKLALESAAANDPDEDVRDQARRSLGRGGR